MKYTKHPVKTKYLYKSETNGSVYAVITKSSKNSTNETTNMQVRSKKFKLFDDITNKELWSSKMIIDQKKVTK
jgi:hypothetical protein